MPDDQGRKNAQFTMEDERHHLLREQGILFIDEEIVDSYAAAVHRDLLYMRSLPALAQKPIWIILNSPGGEAYQGLALHDMLRAMRESGITINILSIGAVTSVAATIQQAGTRRFSLPNTRFMIHQVKVTKFFAEEGVEDAQDSAEVVKAVNKVVLGIIAERTGKPLRKILESTERKREIWLDAKEAKEFGPNGLIDEITEKLPF